MNSQQQQQQQQEINTMRHLILMETCRQMVESMSDSDFDKLVADRQKFRQRNIIQQRHLNERAIDMAETHEMEERHFIEAEVKAEETREMMDTYMREIVLLQMFQRQQYRDQYCSKRAQDLYETREMEENHFNETKVRAEATRAMNERHIEELTQLVIEQDGGVELMAPPPTPVTVREPFLSLMVPPPTPVTVREPFLSLMVPPPSPVSVRELNSYLDTHVSPLDPRQVWRWSSKMSLLEKKRV